MVSTAKISYKASHLVSVTNVCSHPSSQISLPTLRESVRQLTESVPREISLADVLNVDVEEKVFDVLDEVDHPFLTDVSPEQLEAFKRLSQDVEKAFRSLQSGKSMGKIVVEPQPDDRVPVFYPPAFPLIMQI